MASKKKDENDADRITEWCGDCKSTDLIYDRTVVKNPATGAFNVLDYPPFAQAQRCKRCGSENIQRVIAKTAVH